MEVEKSNIIVLIEVCGSFKAKSIFSMLFVQIGYSFFFLAWMRIAFKNKRNKAFFFLVNSFFLENFNLYKLNLK